MNDETHESLPPPVSLARDSASPDAETDGAAQAHYAETIAQTPAHVASANASVIPLIKAKVPGYEILGELGRGGMGVVYKARHLKLNRIVALKMVLGAQHADPRELARFLGEAQAVAAIRHPNIIQVFDSGEADGYPFMAMECLLGGNLSHRLRTSGKLTPRAAAELLIKLARGVQAAHECGIIHRDLKPHNVLLDVPPPNSPPGTWGEPKVMDFGLAKSAGAVLTQTGAVMGTPAYMAPEQAKGETKNIGPAADIYALGVILYECLCGSVPFKGSDAWSVIRQVVSDEPEPVTRRIRGIPRDLDLICRKCLAKEQRERYATAAALADDLQRYLNGEAIRGPRTDIWYAGRKALRRQWRPVLAVGALVVLILVAWMLDSPLGWLRGPKEQPVAKEERPEDKKDDPIATILREKVVNQVTGHRQTKPAPDRESPHPVTVFPELPPPDLTSFKVLRDERVVDMRGWRPITPADPGAESYVVHKNHREFRKIAPANELRVETRTSGREIVSKVSRPKPELVRVFATDKPGIFGNQPMKVRHLVLDVRDIAVDGDFAVRFVSTHWNSLQTDEDRWFGVTGYAGAVQTSMLMLFPDDRPFRDYHFRSATTPAAAAELYSGPVIAIAAEDKSWLYWEIPNPKAHHIYSVKWTW